MSTFYPKEADIEKKWYLIDLKDQTLGRATTKIAEILMGKHKPTYHPAVDTGDFIVVVNSDQVKLTGRKLSQKIYYRHTGYMGGLKQITAEKQLEKDSTMIIQKAVKGMLPKNKLGRKMLKKLKIFANDQHTHAAQSPIELKL